MGVQIVNDSVSIAATSTDVVAHREKRLSLILTNNSDETIYLAINAAAVLNKGIPLKPDTPFILDNQDLINYPIKAISTSGSKNLCVMEIYLDAL